MNAEFVAIGVHNNGRPATGRHDRRLKGKRHLVIFEMPDRFIEVIQPSTTYSRVRNQCCAHGNTRRGLAVVLSSWHPFDGLGALE